MTGKTHIAGGIAAGAAVGLALNLPMEHTEKAKMPRF